MDTPPTIKRASQARSATPNKTAPAPPTSLLRNFNSPPVSTSSSSDSGESGAWLPLPPFRRTNTQQAKVEVQEPPTPNTKQAEKLLNELAGVGEIPSGLFLILAELIDYVTELQDTNMLLNKQVKALQEQKIQDARTHHNIFCHLNTKGKTNIELIETTNEHTRVLNHLLETCAKLESDKSTKEHLLSLRGKITKEVITLNMRK